MGCDTKGLLIYKKDNSNQLDIMHNIRSALQKLVVDGWRNSGKYANYFQAKNDYRYPKIEYSSFSKDVHTFTLYFTYEKEQRMMHLTLGCEGDADRDDNFRKLEKGESTVWLSLGMWGNSDLYLKTALESLKKFGDTYFTHNDCSDEWEKL